MAIKKQEDADPFAAVESLRDALIGIGIVLPSLQVNQVSPHLEMVELGRVRADVAFQLANALQRGGRA
ncbi:hypothetical protein [Saccharopolyspora sp. NPDC002686]|uniref:hypothetical protein n=1 Tax=Saccharopolyspora sp. NPDC002686 TaxID=3154541 RepID=UPI003323D682